MNRRRVEPITENPSTQGHTQPRVHQTPTPPLPSKPCSDDPPVFSIYQTDVIYYGDNLVDYLVREFKVGHPRPQGITADRRVPFWSDLVDL